MTKPDHWECFSDPCYYDMWAVRRGGQPLFHRTIHVRTKEEAEFFVESLNSTIDTASLVGVHQEELRLLNERLEGAASLNDFYQLRASVAETRLQEAQAKIQAMLPVVKAAVRYHEDRDILAPTEAPLHDTVETFLTTPYAAVLETPREQSARIVQGNKRLGDLLGND